MAKKIKNRYGNFIEEHKCSGDCCRYFFIMGRTIEELREQVNSGRCTERDKQIPDMLIALTYEEAKKRSVLGRNNFQIKTKEDYKNNIYTCKNFDEQSNKCLIYKTRPDMCRTYPYCRSEGCEYKSCTLKFINVTKPMDAIDKLLSIAK